MLAVMKVNAAYVPLDSAFPAERIRFIIDDAEIKAIVSMSSFNSRLASIETQKVFLDTAKPGIDAKPDTRPTDMTLTADPICYIIYTSGTTGHPKGVAIAHASICNFVRVTSDLYGYAQGDRVYQDMTIAFDFSIEEIWVPLMAGATLVTARPGPSMIGDELADFLHESSTLRALPAAQLCLRQFKDLHSYASCWVSAANVPTGGGGGVFEFLWPH